jgi:hypothetical protein
LRKARGSGDVKCRQEKQQELPVRISMYYGQD